jgi:hypothetical protein
MIICKARTKHIGDDSTSSDHEDDSDGNSSPSPTRSPHAEDLDGGEAMDHNEDADLDGQDSHRLLDVFQAEVCSGFLSVQPLILHFLFSAQSGPV